MRYRIDGILHPAVSLPTGVHAALVSRIKVLAGMNIAERRRPQDGQFSTKVGDREVDFRVATAKTHDGEMVDNTQRVYVINQAGTWGAEAVKEIGRR